MSAISQYLCILSGNQCTYAMMLTCFPFALSAMLSASLADLASILPLGGTAATMTSMPLCASASVIPRQYCMPGIKCPASRNSSNPRRPCARTMVFFYDNQECKAQDRCAFLQEYLDGISQNYETNRVVLYVPYFSRMTANSSTISRPKSDMRGSSLRHCELLS